jgi:hypothetical protein
MKSEEYTHTSYNICESAINKPLQSVQFIFRCYLLGTLEIHIIVLLRLLTFFNYSAKVGEESGGKSESLNSNES